MVKSYTVELDAGNITIWENGEELVTGSVVDCEIINKMKSKPTAGLSITLYTDTDKITFRLREKSGKGSQPNGQIPILSEQVIHRVWRRHWLFLEILMILLANRQIQIMMHNNL